MNPYLSTIGYQGPNILLAIIIVNLAWQHNTNPTIYLAVVGWQIASHLLNVVIKNTLKAPRPDSQPAEFDKLKETITLKNYLIIHRNFGMPSGHAQSVWSELIFIALYFKSPLLTTAAAIQTGITLWQRYKAHRHSLTQLAIGSLLGIGIGLGFYQIITNTSSSYLA